LAERQGKVTRSVREYFLGHNLKSVELRYNLGKKLSPESLEELRAVYARCEPFLSTTPTGGEGQAQSKIAKVMLMGLGYTEKELSTVDFDSLDMTTFQELVTKKVPSGGSRAQQRLADTDELPGLLKEGWRVVTAVNGHQVVLEPPNHR